MITVLYAGNENEYENKRLLEEAKNFDNLEIKNALKLTYPPKLEDFKDTKVFYFYRSIGKAGIANIEMLIDFLEVHGVRIVNKIFKNYRLMRKTMFYYYLIKNKIRTPKIMKIYDENQIEELLSLEFPMLAKFDFIHRGLGVYLIENKEQLEKFVKNNKRKLKYIVFQEFIPYEKDIRIITVGKPIGGMERINPNSFKANIAQGGYGVEYKLDNEILDISKKLSKIFDMEIFAFDVLIKNNFKYIVDLHVIFRFEGFEKYTKKNIAKAILEYLNDIHSNC
ncbi:MAG: hypothetical protein QXP34_00785 [Candidatus Aenigmatarchaeota archaeon]